MNRQPTLLWTHKSMIHVVSKLGITKFLHAIMHLIAPLIGGLILFRMCSKKIFFSRIDIPFHLRAAASEQYDI